MYQLSLLVATLVLSTWVNASLPQADPQGRPLPSLSTMLKEVNPAVVNIATFSEQQMSNNPLLNDPFFRRFFNIPEQQPNQQPRKLQRSAGSGVIIDADEGIVVTNYHVIKDSDEIRVSLTDGRHYVAKLLGSDPELDVAVLQIKNENLSEVPLGDSEALEVGDFVVAIGNPFGIGQTVTTGIVSALGRTGLGIEGYENFIQTDASINPGNSGGALVNLNGQLIGINTAIIAPAGGNVGIGFAIPMDMVKSSVEQIIEDGEVKRGQLGIGIQDITVDLQIAFDLKNGQQGVLITGVAEDSEAAKAGLKPDDIIVAIEGEKVISTGNLRSQIGKRKIGDKVKVTFLRDGKEKSLRVKIGDPIQQSASSGNLHRLLDGARFENNTEGRGVVVAELERNSLAAYSGLRPGDIILGANRLRINDMDDFREALRRDDDRILLRVQRGRSSFYVVIQ
ncbi:DegQ family serine endoprotease [Aliikangiella marina]|uniref:DegQ family serine endoprotease n=1 Tax=Aliikangiella marina TaxID=1712262 RepID=A0A545T5D7_9GAMM|nr:DegQ family serine endoprotease [Aliikangiella marina]TQV72434.1 DegQ family serine endoprotease [Aliikangiella marina]